MTEDVWDFLSEEFGYNENEKEVLKARSAEIKKKIEGEEIQERNEIASKILIRAGIEHEKIKSANFGAHLDGIPFASIWYKDKQGNITGALFEHSGEWRLSIHDGKEAIQ